MDYPQLAQRVFHTPLLAAPAKAAAFAAGLGPRLLGAPVQVEGAEPTAATRARPQASVLDDRLEDEIRMGRRTPFRSIEGAAVIPITGSLVHRGSFLGESLSGHQSYEGISAQLTAARESPMVRGVALEIDSFGGEVAMCFELAEEIRALRAEKPVWAFVSAHAFSAAYALASQADRIIIPRSGGVGSIGVICMHADYSQRLEDGGIRVTVIAAGARKAEGNPYEPLPEAVRARLAQECEDLRVLFAETVGEGRGAALTAEAALATEAGTFIGQKAVDVGLADEVASPRAAFERFLAQINGRSVPAPTQASKQGDQTMSNRTDPQGQQPPQQAASAPTHQPAASEAPTPAAPTTQAGGDAPAQPSASAPAQPGANAPTPDPAPAKGASDERTRIAGILNHPEAEGRADLAKSFAFESEMSVDEAAKHLAAAPKSGSGQTLSAAMDAEATELDAPPAAGGDAPRMADRMKGRFAN
ncbi:S49 family peptidase [Salipiger mucosus]|uniref:Peptidase S49 domain-containing protein n=1 Tax=Salipiger mucosus DSM 16094 TaxID=1123237 RepID=S9QR63_9RHOB|nr:S49 family peptidase [Salipiger mucosus]EPX82093.1 hypothetical protein Salmuc_02461 [Salipiger mucosus DSM 16094]